MRQKGMSGLIKCCINVLKLGSRAAFEKAECIGLSAVQRGMKEQLLTKVFHTREIQTFLHLLYNKCIFFSKHVTNKILKGVLMMFFRKKRKFFSQKPFF